MSQRRRTITARVVSGVVWGAIVAVAAYGCSRVVRDEPVLGYSSLAVFLLLMLAAVIGEAWTRKRWRESERVLGGLDRPACGIKFGAADAHAAIHPPPYEGDGFVDGLECDVVVCGRCGAEIMYDRAERKLLGRLK